MTPYFYNLFNISLFCYNSILSFTGNLWVLLLGHHLKIIPPASSSDDSIGQSKDEREGPWESGRGEASPFPFAFVLCALLSLKKKRYVWERGSHSPVLPCASLLSIISRVISARTLKNGSVFFAAGPRHRDKSSFSRKRIWRPIIYFCCFELSNKFICVK